jgi:heme-degrading monooxygenase HmoA
MTDVSIERFDNRSRPGWLLSLSLWRDESALVAWREVFEHRVAQQKPPSTRTAPDWGREASSFGPSVAADRFKT